MIRELARDILAPLRRVSGRLSRGPIVLLYHRINTAATDANGLYVSPKNFREHLDVLRRHYWVMTLGELSDQWQRGIAPNNAVALTFDDGYLDNLETACPLLELFDTPATFFLATGRVVKDRDYWWDELERIVLREPTLPSYLNLRIGSSTREWWSRDDWDGVDPNLQTEHRLRRLSRREQLFQDLHSILIALVGSEQIDVQDQLIDWVGSTCESREPVMSCEQIALLAQTRLFEIGAHSVNHPLLTGLSVSQQVLEMRCSRQWLEGITQEPVTSFAYPYGAYDTASVEAARMEEFQVGCTCDIRRTNWQADPLALPRLSACNEGGDKFARALRWLLPHATRDDPNAHHS